MILNLVQLATAMIIHFSRMLPCTAFSLHSVSVSVALVTLGINKWMERWVLPHCVTLISSTLIERFVSMEMLTKNHFNWLEVVDAFVSIVCFFFARFYFGFVVVAFIFFLCHFAIENVNLVCLFEWNAIASGWRCWWPKTISMAMCNCDHTRLSLCVRLFLTRAHLTRIVSVSYPKHNSSTHN